MAEPDKCLYCKSGIVAWVSMPDGSCYLACTVCGASGEYHKAEPKASTHVASFELSLDGGVVQRLINEATDLGYRAFRTLGTSLECSVTFTSAKDGLPEYVYGNGPTLEHALYEAIGAMRAWHSTQPQ